MRKFEQFMPFWVQNDADVDISNKIVIPDPMRLCKTAPILKFWRIFHLIQVKFVMEEVKLGKEQH